MQTFSYDEASQVTYVSELIDEDTCSWRSDQVAQCINPDDAVAIILGISLCAEPEDFIVRQYDNKCIFTVKSSYTVHVDICVGAESISSLLLPPTLYLSSTNAMEESWKNSPHTHTTKEKIMTLP
jgi:hypothetical protein